MGPHFFLYPYSYLHIFLFLLFIGLLLLILLILTYALSYKSSYQDADKLASYECGFEPFEDTRATFDVQFYLIAIIFIVFDVEIAFLYPWIISLREFNSLEIFLPGFLFFIFVILGFIFEWYQGALSWKMSNLSKIQLFTACPLLFDSSFFSTDSLILPYIFDNTNKMGLVIVGVVIVALLAFTVVLTLETTVVIYTAFIFNFFLEKQWVLFFVFIILLFILLNFWLTLDEFDYNIDSKIIIVYNAYAICTLFLLNSTNLFEIFLAMEGISLSLVILIAYKTQRFSALEAAIKYFVQSSIIGCFFSFSVAILYLITDTFFLSEIFYFFTYSRTGFYSQSTLLDIIYNPFLIYIFFTLIFCVFFKLSLFPLHFWTPDVYNGSPLIITTLFATVNKLIFFITFLTIAKYSIFLFFGSLVWKFLFSPLFQLSAIISILIGALGAFRQTSIKRFFGYTTINTLGFILLPIAVQGVSGAAISLSYLIVYLSMSVFFFILIAKVYNYKDSSFWRVYYISDLSGIYKVNKLLSFSLTFVILVFSGLPPYVTFYNKYFIMQLLTFSSINIYYLVIILISTMITSFYYIRFIKSIFYEQPYLQTVLSQIELKHILSQNKVIDFLDNLVIIGTGRFEFIFVLFFIIYGVDYFEIVQFLL